MKLSKIISVIVHPILIPIITFYTSLKLVPNIGFAITSYINLIWTILVLSTIILPVLSLLYLKYIGKIESFEMTEHKERPLPLLITGIWMLIGLRQLDNILYFAPILKIELICAIIIIFLASIISRFDFLPVRKLSTPITFWLSERSSSTKWLPIKPAAPVTSHVRFSNSKSSLLDW